MKSPELKIKNLLKIEESKPKEFYSSSGVLRSVGWYLPNGKLHREYGPAYIRYTENGTVYGEEFYLDGMRHREDGPAYIIKDIESGEVIEESFFLRGTKIT